MSDYKSLPLEKKNQSSETVSTFAHIRSEREWQSWGAIDKMRE